MADTISRTEVSLKTEVLPTEKAPPRPGATDAPSTPSKAVGYTPVSAARSDATSGRADVTISTDTNNQEKVHLNVDTHESTRAKKDAAAGGLPRNPEEWKRLLAKAAPWLAAAAIVGLAGYSAQHKDDIESTGRRLARKADRKADEAESEAKRGWFGLKANADRTADKADDKLYEAKHKADKKAHEAKGAIKGAAHDVEHAASRVVHKVEGALDNAKHAVQDVAHGAKHTAKDTAHSVKENAEVAKDKTAEKAAKAQDGGFMMWRSVTAGVKEKYAKTKHEAGHLAHEAKEGVKHGADKAAHAAHDAKENIKHKAEDVADAARHAEQKAEAAAYKNVAKGLAGAGKGEEVTGKVLKEAGKRIEKDGHNTKEYYRGQEVKGEAKKKFLGIF